MSAFPQLSERPSNAMERRIKISRHCGAMTLFGLAVQVLGALIGDYFMLPIGFGIVVGAATLDLTLSWNEYD